MPAPQPTAPYDALTAEARELLFRTASYLSPSEQAELEKPSPTPFTPMTDKPVKAANPTLPTPLPSPRNLHCGTWTYKACARA